MGAGVARAELDLPPLGPHPALEALRYSVLVLALVPAAFDFPGPPAPPAVHYTGPVLDPDPVTSGWAPPGNDDRRPLVLVSFGTTTQAQGRALPPVLDALAGLPVRGLL